MSSSRVVARLFLTRCRIRPTQHQLEPGPLRGVGRQRRTTHLLCKESTAVPCRTIASRKVSLSLSLEQFHIRVAMETGDGLFQEYTICVAHYLAKLCHLTSRPHPPCQIIQKLNCSSFARHFANFSETVALIIHTEKRFC